jgi:4-hydroxy-tetrahydrodipicolinate reductase
VDIDVQGAQAEFLSQHREAPIPIVSHLNELPGAIGDVVIQCTGSRLTAVAPQIQEALEWGASVVSTCEELSFPWRFHAELANEIDNMARSRHATVLATGINPGFAMDALPVFMSAVTDSIAAVRVRRVVDTAKRREALQRKTGAGISREEFEAGVEAGSIGHAGLRESVAMIANGLDLEVDAITVARDPIVAEYEVDTVRPRIPIGSVSGIREIATGWAAGRPIIVLDLQMYAGAPMDEDELQIASDPPIQVLTRGIRGDTATAAIVANLIPELSQLPPGLHTMLDLVRIRSRGTVVHARQGSSTGGETKP